MITKIVHSKRQKRPTPKNNKCANKNKYNGTTAIRKEQE